MFRLRLTTLLLALSLVGCVRAGFGVTAGRGDSVDATQDAGSVDVERDGATFPPYEAGTVPGEWVSISAGSFTMGSPPSEPCREGIGGHKETAHKVTLSRAFEIVSTEVTQQQFTTLMGYNPAYHQTCGSGCPVEHLTWEEALSYCNALSSRRKLEACYTCSGAGSTITCTIAAKYAGVAIYSCPGYRLPTEAEWEYAYRAGTTTPLYNGSITACDSKDAAADAIGWYGANAQGRPHPAKQKTPNKWGLYDMAGNVWEWCHDSFLSNLGADAVTNPVVGLPTSTCRIERGGSFEDWPGHMRGAGHRNCFSRDKQTRYLGFRPVRTL